MEDNLNVFGNENLLQIFEIWNNLNMYANGKSLRRPTISIWLQLAPTGPDLGTAQPQLAAKLSPQLQVKLSLKAELALFLLNPAPPPPHPGKFIWKLI